MSRRGLEELEAEFDLLAKYVPRIDAALKELGDGWEYEGEFCQRVGTAPRIVAKFYEKYADLIVIPPRGGKRIWCGNKKFADKVRERLRGK